MIGTFRNITPTAGEVALPLPGDQLVPHPDVVMDRAFAVDAAPGEVWPWLVQLGKHRAGWYLPRRIERFLPPSRRASRTLDPRWLDLQVGDVIPDYGGREATFRVATIDSPGVLVYESRRGRTAVSWSINATPSPRLATRIHLRLRLGPVRRPWLAENAGGLLDMLTIAGMAAGLAERLAETRRAGASGSRQ
jgi:hypothetical protein